MLAGHPQVTSYDLVDEVQPRINYLKFLAGAYTRPLFGST